MYKYLFLAMLTTGCHEFNRQYVCAVEGNECDVTDKSGSQDRETTGNLPGPRGEQGEQGNSGLSCSVESLGNGESRVFCEDGTEVVIRNGDTGERGEQGAEGAAGQDGQDGEDGKDGIGCTVTPASNGALVTCGDTSVLVLNGTNGTDGQDGQDGQDAPPTAYTVTELVDPCGDKPGVYDEVFLRLANGMLVASFSDNTGGQNTRFSILTAGSYMTTDGSSCKFSVDANGQLYNEYY